MTRIFLSYTRSDLPRIESLLDSLKANDLDIWRDAEDIRGGEKWPKAIGEAIDSHDKILLIWSKDSSQSHFVELEWNTAVALKKTIVPLQLDDTQLPPTLSSYNGIMFEDAEESLPDILEALQVHQEVVPEAHRKKVISILGEIDGKSEKAATEKAVQKYLDEKWIEIIGNVFREFEASGSSLKSHIRIKDFETIVNERTKDFVGREFIFNRIDEVISNPDFTSGYVVIKGEPGIGKTALISQLVKQRGYVHHFNSITDNIRSAHTFISNICAQLVIKYGLDYSRFPDRASEDAGFMRQLLAEAVEKSEDKKVIVAVDALDEADDPGLQSGGNILYLPRILPDGVFFIVTMREKHDERLDVDRKEYVPLDDEDPKNVEDVGKYIVNYLVKYQNQMSSRLKEWNIDEARFEEELVEKSEGNFQYIHYVLPAIKDGKLNSLRIGSIEDLPTGLQGYYERHWRAMESEDRDRYKRLQRPVLCFLATALEPIGIKMLMEWMAHVELEKIPDPDDVLGLIKEWREFLNLRRSDGGEKLYHIYHRSFSEFLDKEEGLTVFHGMIAKNAMDKVRAAKKQIERG